MGITPAYNLYYLPMSELFIHIKLYRWHIIYVSGFVLLFWYLSMQMPHSLPNTDEAISILLGKLGLAAQDWTSFQAANWYGATVHIYPIISALSYDIGGIMASRIISLLSSLIIIESLLFAVLPFVKTSGLKLSAVFFVLFLFIRSPGYAYYGTYASYDMISLALFIASLTQFFWIYKNPITNGKKYFIATTLALFSFFTNYHLFIYVSCLLIISYCAAYYIPDRAYRFYAKKYILIPSLFFSSCWIATHYSSLPTIFQNISIPFLNDINEKHFLPLTLLLTTALLLLITNVQWKNLTGRRKVGVTFVCLILIIACWYRGQMDIPVSNSNIFPKKIYAFFSEKTNPYDRILTESGPVLMIAAFHHTHPLRIATFSWFRYHNIEGADAYRRAVQDGYFHYIELIKPDKEKDKQQATLSEIVRSNLNLVYRKEYETETNEIYKRNY